MPQFTALTSPSDKELDTLIDMKLKALFAHYEINSTDAFEGGPKMAPAWANLAWHLAREHVPASSACREDVEDPPRGDKTT